jgi:hypothetical protein
MQNIDNSNKELIFIEENNCYNSKVKIERK